MAGGSGERFWPASRASMPKQLLNLGDPNRSLLQEAVARVEPLVGKGNVSVLIGKPIEATVRASGVVPEANVIVEPAKRNTLGCLCWHAAHLLAEGRADATLAILTADHKIAPEEAFCASLATAFEAAEATGSLVTLGIRPTRPETGYGYIEVADGSSPSGVAYPVAAFREKPDLATAETYVAGGKHFWNSGMFVWTLAAFLRELEAVQPDAFAKTHRIAEYLALGSPAEAADVFEQLPSISIDFALMEHAKKVMVVPASFTWDDVGSWDALTRTLPNDASGNAIVGDALIADSNDCIVYNGASDQVVGLVGCEGLVVSVMGDAVLVCPKDRAQEVRKLVEALKAKGDPRV